MYKRKERQIIGIVDGFSIVSLPEKEVRQLAMLFGKGGDSKTGHVFSAIAIIPGLKSDEVAIEADAVGSYIPRMCSHATTKLMNHGLMLHCVEPAGKPRNGDYHQWYLVEAPIEYLSVEMAVNDPILKD